MQWTRSETLALSQPGCAYCLGIGLRPGADRKHETPCGCVLRKIFRICHKRFRKCAEAGQYISRVSLEANRSRQRKVIWGLKNEEFMADFSLIAQRTLTERHHKIFRFHFLLGADWRQCTKKLGCTRGDFFHEVYRMEEALGRAFRETEPHALFPVDEYFGMTSGVAAQRKVKREDPSAEEVSTEVRECKRSGCGRAVLAGSRYCSLDCVREDNPPNLLLMRKRALPRQAPGMGMTREVRLLGGSPVGPHRVDA